MRTLFLTLIFAFITMQTFAQTLEYLSFKDVPIDGTLTDEVSISAPKESRQPILVWGH